MSQEKLLDEADAFVESTIRLLLFSLLVESISVVSSGRCVVAVVRGIAVNDDWVNIGRVMLSDDRLGV